MLTGVTITGADDKVEPGMLRELTMRYPFVEWGILHSLKRRGTARYPSEAWLGKLGEEKTKARDRSARWGEAVFRLSAHLCGEIARQTLAGSEEGLIGLKGIYERVQLNGFALPATSLVKMFEDCAPLYPYEFVLQITREDQLQGTADMVSGVEAQLAGDYLAGLDFAKLSVSALYDPSGGRGLEAFRWPVAPMGLRLGYAGGIKPSNLEEVVREIGPVDLPYWLDMESGVRTGDEFDLGLVVQVLDVASRFMVAR
jgi:hypothetical protein